MTLAVFGDMDEQPDQGDGEFLSADVANRVEILGMNRAYENVIAVECGVDGCDQSVGWLVVIVFAAERCQLIF